MSNRKELIVCDCGDIDHQMVLFHYKDEDFMEEYIIVNIHLADSLSLWERIKYALLYIVGKRSIYGAFGEILLTHKQVEELKLICDKFLVGLD